MITGLCAREWLGKIYRHDPPLGAEVGVDESILLYSGCFDVVFDIEGKGRIEPVLDSPSERTDQPNRFNLKAYNSLDFTAIPEAGYVLDDVLINGEKMLVSAGSSFRIPEIVKDYCGRDPIRRDCSGSRASPPLRYPTQLRRHAPLIRLPRRFCSVRALSRRLARSWLTKAQTSNSQSPRPQEWYRR